MANKPRQWRDEIRVEAQALLDAGSPDEALSHLATKRQVQNAVHRGILHRKRLKAGNKPGYGKRFAKPAEQAHISG